MSAFVLIRLAHFTGLSLWIAGICAMALLLRAGARNKAAGVLADVGATITIISGLYNAFRNQFFSQTWLHMKLGLVAVLIIVHVLLRVRTRKGAAGGVTGLLALAIVVAIGIMFLVIAKPLRS